MVQRGGLLSAGLYLMLFGYRQGLLVAVVTLIIGYATIHKTRICETCGKVNPYYPFLGPGGVLQ